VRYKYLTYGVDENMGNIRVLIADDEKEIRDLVKKYLEPELYQVDTAVDGEEALRLFESHKYDLILLDLMMPKIDGIEVCRRLRNLTNIPILMLTAKDQEIDKILGLGIGADDYMTKPFSINELVARIKAHLEQVFTKSQIFRQVWGSAYLEDDNTVMVYIRKLRKKIEADPSDPRWIQTVWGIGYKFAGEKDEA